MKCSLCEQTFNGDREPIFSRKPPICEKCGTSFVENMFASDEFNRWLDSFLQSRLQIHVPTYDEYYKRYNLRRCPDCNGTGFIETKTCKTCHGVGTIRKDREHECRICHKKLTSDDNHFFTNEMIKHAEEHLARGEKPDDTFRGEDEYDTR